MTDDQGIDAIEGLDFPNTFQTHTPHLSRLASRGPVLITTRANPLCSPTRAGILSGRAAMQTGETGTIEAGLPRFYRNRLALQGEERTIAEVLQDLGYYTILIDKWHVAFDRALGQTPDRQGFDLVEYVGWYRRFDDPDVVGDEHITRMTDLAVQAVENRPDPEAPVALFFWSIEPHRKKREDSDGFGWWRVHTRLLPSGEDYYAPHRDSNRNRFRAMVEAIDTEFARLLSDLRVLDEQGAYREASDTVVFFTSDNGTSAVISEPQDRAKGTLYEGGTRVQLIVFGERVPEGGVDDRLVSHLDFYETLADIAGADESIRGARPRQSMSFADRIGWRDEPLPERRYTVSNIEKSRFPIRRAVGIADTRFKLIVPSGYGWARPSEFLFYDLNDDPGEQEPLPLERMSPEQEAAFHAMREQVVNDWPSAVNRPFSHHIDLPATHAAAIDNFDTLHQDLLPLGHDPLDANGERESRILLRFDPSALRSVRRRVERVQLIVTFNADSPRRLAEGDTDPIRIHPATVDWHSQQPTWDDVANAWREEVELGTVDLPPHVIVRPPDSISGIPMPSGTPVSFGHDEDWFDLLQFWMRHPDNNHGVVLKADRIPGMQKDQSVTFLPEAYLRITLRRD